MAEIQKNVKKLYRDATRIHLKRTGYDNKQIQVIIQDLFNTSIQA